LRLGDCPVECLPFGGLAPRIVGIAVSADTDNTGEAVTAWFGDLRFIGR
jgi:hypothetical protein